MEGTGYAIGEVIIYLVVSAILGFGVGWLLGRWTQRTAVETEVEDQLAAERERTRQMEARLGERSRDLDGVRTELSRARRLIAASNADQSLADQLVAAQEETSRLASSLQEKEAEVARLTEASAGLEQAHRQIDELERELVDLGAQVDAGRERIAELEASQAAPAETEPAVEEAAPVLPAGEVAATTEMADLPDKEEATARVAAIAARTAGDGPAVDDDLKRVHGIGPKLERLLKDMGITSYRQIAAFRDDDIAYVTAALDAFAGRIERDDWMSSAAREHEKKYGSPPAAP
ncbi:MAG: hypothetical protein PVI35_00900 [Acidimicrobiia bacterium]|jgi:predicted flap endonuclease-1-like 5' DNA nuclease